MLWSLGQTDIPELSSILFSGLALKRDLEVFFNTYKSAVTPHGIHHTQTAHPHQGGSEYHTNRVGGTIAHVHMRQYGKP
jgi:hypothetical protein